LRKRLCTERALATLLNVDADEQARRDGWRSAAEQDQHEQAYWEQAYAEDRAAAIAPSPWELYAGGERESLPAPPLTIANAALLAGVHHVTVRRRLGRLEADGLASKIGSRWLLKPEAVEALKERPTPEPRTARAKRRRMTQEASESELW
jgi:Fic family protein